jgi:arginase
MSEAAERDWALIGVPSSAGAHHAGQERTPAALRKAGLVDRLRAAGLSVVDLGDLPETPFALDRDHPAGRNLPAVVSVARQVADRVADVAGSGRLPLVVGGDCTITLGVIAGLRQRHPDVGLAYLDGDADLSTPDHPEAPGSGIFDSMGIAHLLGGGAPELAGIGGTTPLLDPSRLAMMGCDPREIDLAGRRFLAERRVSFQDGPVLAVDPAAAASRALADIAGAIGPLAVHFDIDTVDSGDLPLGNFPHYGSGVRFDQAIECLRVLLRHEPLAALVLTEVNPTHDATGELISQYLDGIVSALAGA